MNTKTAAIDPAANPGGTPEQLTGTPEDQAPHVAAESVKEQIAELSKIVKQQENAAEQHRLALAQIEKVRAEYAKTRPMPGPKPSNVGYRTMADIMQGDAINDDERRMKRLADRCLTRMICDGNVQFKKVRNPDTREMEVQYVVPESGAWEYIPAWREFSRLRDHVVTLAASDAYDTTDASSWVPTLFSSEFSDFYRIRGDFLAALRTVQIPRGTGSYRIPNMTTDVQARLISETTSVDEDFLNTSAVFQGTAGGMDLEPKKHFIIQSVSTEGEEDFVMDVIAMMNREIDAILVGAVEQSVINGQTTDDTDLDDAPAASGLYSANGYSDANGDNGLRLHCVINSFDTSIGGKLTGLDVLAARESMGKFGVRPSETLAVMSPKAYLGLLQDQDTAGGGVTTVDRLGSAATLLTGQLASIGGVPVIVSDQFPEDIAATGIDAGTGATTGAVILNRRRWIMGIKRAMNRTMLPQPGYDSMNIVGSTRTHLTIAATDEHSAHYLYNIT